LRTAAWAAQRLREVAAEPAPEGVVALNQADTCALAAD